MTEKRDRPGGWSFRPGEEISGPLDFSMRLPLATDGPPFELHWVFTDDGLYVPAIVRQPNGSPPFPTVVVLHGGSGGVGVSWLAEFAHDRGYVLERLLEAGYAVCFTEGRMEVEDAYGMDSVTETTPSLPTVLDHQDIITTVDYLRERPFVDEERVAMFGVSHGGELLLKAATEMDDDPAALLAMEPGAIEYLGLSYDGPRAEPNLQFNEPLEDTQITIDAAMERINQIDDETPILVGGRDTDHLQGLFRKLHELLDRAGKEVYWESWDHERHTYQWGPKRSGRSGPYSESPIEDRYDVDVETRATIDRTLAFLDEKVRE